MASSSSSTRSQLIDYTYQHVHRLLSGHREGLSPDQIVIILESRLDKFRKLSEPFGVVSDAARAKINSGSVTLADGITIQVEEVDKEVVIAISKRFNINEVDALILLRSFLYNEGLPSVVDSDALPSLIEEVVNVLTPFYFSECLSIHRILISLLRSRETIEDPFHDSASELLSKIFKDDSAYTDSILSEYLRKTKAPVPENLSNIPRTSAQWAKQNMKEQLGLLEVLFWLLWDYVPCYASVVVRIFEAAYQTQLGNNQENSTLMLDDEGMQLQRDTSALWIILIIEVLNLEQVLDPGLDISNAPEGSDKPLLHHSPSSHEKIHKLVLSNTHPGYVCIFVAWAFYLKGISVAVANLSGPPGFEQFLIEIGVKHGNTKAKDEEQIHYSMVTAALRPESGLFEMLKAFLTSSPLFVTTIAWKTGSTITDPNAVAYRSVLKGLIISLVEYQPVEYIQDFEGLVDVWIALFGNSESSSVSKLCRQYWDHDFRQNASRRAIIDVARSRFPIQLQPLTRILRSMTGSGSMGLSEAEALFNANTIDVDRQQCSAYVFHYFRTLSTYTQVLGLSARTGANALYDRVVERRGPSSSGGVVYTNLRPMKLPGGSTLPLRSVGRLLSSDSSIEAVLVAWQHQHSGWRVLVDVLLDYVRKRQGDSFEQTDMSRRTEQPVQLYLREVGIEVTSNYDSIVCDILELILSIIQENPIQTAALMECLEESLEEDDSIVSGMMKDTSSPDLVQLVIMILEDALARPQQKSYSSSSPVAPAISILSALLSLRDYSNRVWLYLRSTSVLFGADRTSFTTSVLEAERRSGHYTTTLALLHLVQKLLEEAISSLLVASSEQPRMQSIKDEVLLRVLQFVHGEVWAEYTTWRYARLSDRFILGQCIIDVFSRILEANTVLSSINAFTNTTSFVSQTLVSHATVSSINPLVHGMATGATILSTLRGLRRYAEIRHLGFFLESCLKLIRTILHVKGSFMNPSYLCLLEQMLCKEITLGKTKAKSGNAQANPIDVLANYIKEKGFGPKIPLNAVLALTALCLSLSSCQSAPPTIIGHLWDPPAIVTSLIRIVQHPYEDLALRYALWEFISTSVDKEPTLAELFVHGQFRIPSIKGKGVATTSDETFKPGDASKTTSSKTSAVEAACNLLAARKELWESNPQLLACAVKFLHVVWQHGLEHKSVLEPLRSDNEFWEQISSLAMEELGPVPDYLTSEHIETEDGEHADVHEPVSIHAYRTTAKSYALHVIGSDIALRKSDSALKLASYSALESCLKTGDLLTDNISECISTSFDPELQNRASEFIRASFKSLTINMLRSHEPLSAREYGDNFMYSVSLSKDLVESPVQNKDDVMKTAQLRYFVYSLNLNLSISHSQATLLDAWTFLLKHVKGFFRSDQKLRDKVISVIMSVARDVASEKRSGDMMTSIHGQRLALLLALLEIAWLQEKLPMTQTIEFLPFMDYLEKIISSEVFPPGKSFLRAVTAPFHCTLLKIMYLAARSCRILSQDLKGLRSEHRLMIDQMIFSMLMLVIDGLRVTFDAASTSINVETDEDMELLVAVFEQCLKSGFNISSGAWLTRCQETDVVGASFTLLNSFDLFGLPDPSMNRERGRPMYVENILLFHMALASVPYGAERLASEGIVPAYCNTNISSALSAGAIETTIPELTGERNPAHRAYCQILFNLASILNSLASPQQFVESQIVGLVQMFGQQISKSLSWTNDDPITLAALDELELSIDIFYLMISGSANSSRSKGPLADICRSYTDHGLQLLQHLNYALTHPRHLAGLLEPITAVERTQIERETSEVTVNTLKELLDPTARPLLIRVIQRLFHVTSQVLSTLNIISNAERVLLSDSEEWLLQEALVVPHSKVSIREPASVGTLLELGNCAFDILRFLTHSDIATAKNTGAQIPLNAWTQSDKKLNIITARRTLEAVLTYAATQLVMWLMKQDGEQSGEIDMEEQVQHPHDFIEQKADGGGNKDREFRRSKRKSLSMADRLRRGMTGEMLVDLQTLTARAKPVVSKSIEVSDIDCVDLLPILAKFLDERAPAS